MVCVKNDYTWITSTFWASFSCMETYYAFFFVYDESTQELSSYWCSISILPIIHVVCCIPVDLQQCALKLLKEWYRRTVTFTFNIFVKNICIQITLFAICNRKYCNGFSFIPVRLGMMRAETNKSSAYGLGVSDWWRKLGGWSHAATRISYKHDTDAFFSTCFPVCNALLDKMSICQYIPNAPWRLLTCPWQNKRV